MTKLPTESWNITPLVGDEYPRYTVNQVCAVPGCFFYTDDKHHIVRRSHMAGDYAWVRMPDGAEVGNLVGLCRRHHDDVTVNRAKIQYEEGKFLWNDLLEAATPLTFQPPMMRKGTVHVEATPFDEQAPVGPAAHSKCPSCKRPMPKPKEEKLEEKRPRRTWAIKVPVDEQENGAELLDSLLGECRDLFGHSESGKVRYFTMIQALALVVQHGPRLVSDE